MHNDRGDREISVHVLTLDELRNPTDAFDADSIDDGILAIVLAMREAGLPTHDSGDGTKTTDDCVVALDFPHVITHCEPTERFEMAHRIMVWAMAHGASAEDVDVVLPGQECAAVVFLHADSVRLA